MTFQFSEFDDVSQMPMNSADRGNDDDEPEDSLEARTSINQRPALKKFWEEIRVNRFPFCRPRPPVLVLR